MTKKTWQEESAAWKLTRIPRYTDGSLVVDGDKIRYHQAPGGMLPHGEFIYGVAKHHRDDDPELYLFDGHTHYGIYSHVIERVA